MNLSAHCYLQIQRQESLAVPLVLVEARLPLPTKVKPSTRVDLVAFDNPAVGLMCMPLALIESGVAEERVIQSSGAVGPVPEAEARRTGIA